MQRSVIYRAIRDRVKERLPWVLYIDMQKGQLRNPSDNYPIPLPALLVEMKDADTTGMLGGGQLAELEVRVHLYIDLVTDSFDTSMQEDETIGILDRWDELNAALHDFTFEAGRFTRFRELAPEYGDRFLMLQTDYKVLVKDVQPAYMKIQPPNVKVSMA